MNARAGVAVTVALALTMAVGSFAWWWSWNPRASTRHLWLKKSEIVALPTYDRHCAKSAACKPPLQCVSDFRVEDDRCLASECAQDLDCDPGFLCRAVPSLEWKPVHLCIMEGPRGEGQPCGFFPTRETPACGRGLVCNYGYCSRPCQLDDPSSCSPGQTCLDSPIVGPSCVPSCTRTGCPSGKRCFRVEGEHSVCGSLVEYAQDCERDPCPSGLECVHATLDDAGHVDMWCEQRCNPQKPCPAGRICMGAACLKPCKDGELGACGPHETCTLYPMVPVWLCTRQ